MAVTGGFKWHGPRVRRKVVVGMERNLSRALDFLAGESVALLGRGGGPTEHSAPGEPPISHTGFLRQRIRTERKKLSGRYGTGVGGGQSVPYAAAMEVGAKPHVINAIAATVLANKDTGQVFGPTVNHPGNAPRPYLRPPLKTKRATLKRIMGADVI
jgi:hypothetical protein